MVESHKILSEGSKTEHITVCYTVYIVIYV